MTLVPASTTLRATAVMAVAAVLLSACGGGAPSAQVGGPAPSPSAEVASPTPSPTPSPEATAPAPPSPEPEPEYVDPPAGTGLDPVTIEIPAIDVDADIIDLGLNPDGTMAVPDDFFLTGHFTYSPDPGEYGASIIVGHIDSFRGPAVFFRLSELQPGDDVTVHGPDGEDVTFEVETVEQYPKDEFPTAQVYSFTEEPTLRLITCGGPFDDTIGHYEDNIIVFARRVEDA